MTGPAVPLDPRYVSVTAIDRDLADQAKAQWYAMQLGNLQGSFVNGFVPEVLPSLVQAQTAAAQLGAASIARTTGRAVSIVPGGFAGYASDGRELPSLLAQPLIQTYVNLDNGVAAADALDSGWDSMDRILSGQVHDAARQAESVQMVEHQVKYYIRYTEPGACSRCLILAGKHYKVNVGFQRHDHCRCFHIAYISTYLDAADGVGPGELVSSESMTAGARDFVEQSPREIFDSLSTAEQDRAFTPAGAQAIRDGASIPQVVNSRRSGMSTVTDRYGTIYKTTTVGAKRGQTRLLPESIAKIAGDDRDEWLRLLRANGYLRS